MIRECVLGVGGGSFVKEKIIEFMSDEEGELFNQKSAAEVGVIKFTKRTHVSAACRVTNNHFLPRLTFWRALYNTCASKIFVVALKL